MFYRLPLRGKTKYKLFSTTTKRLPRWGSAEHQGNHFINISQISSPPVTLSIAPKLLSYFPQDGSDPIISSLFIFSQASISKHNISLC
jgi:hypothetical protein